MRRDTILNGLVAIALLAAVGWFAVQINGKMLAHSVRRGEEAAILKAEGAVAASNRAAAIKPHVPQRLEVAEGMSTQGPIVVNTGVDGGDGANTWSTPTGAASTSSAGAANYGPLGPANPSATLKCQFSAGAFTVPAANAVSQIQVKFNAWYGAALGGVGRIKSIKTTLTGSTNISDSASLTTSDAQYTYTFTGLAVSQADINGAWEIDLIFDSPTDDATIIVDVYKVEATVTYSLIPDELGALEFMGLDRVPLQRRRPHFQPPPIETIDPKVLTLKEAPHPDAFGPMFVQRRPTPQCRAFIEPMERVDPKLLTLPNEVEPLRVEQFMTMEVQRAPTPRRRPEQVILMGEYDPTSLTLPNAPEFIHPENQVPMPCLPIGPQEPRPWLNPISSEEGFVGLLSAGSAEPATYHQIDQNPRRDWPRQYQPPANNLDPGAPTTSSTPLAVLPPMGLPVPQRPRVQPPAIEVRSFVTATGDPSLYPTHFSMTASPPAARRQVRQPAESLILDAWSQTTFPEPPMFVSRPVLQRAAVPGIEVRSLAPQNLGDSQIVAGWETPLSVPVRARQPGQNITLTGELAGETVDLTNLTPTGWQADEPAQINPRRRLVQPPAETVVLELPPSVDPGLLESMSVAVQPGVRRPRPAESLVVFTEVPAANGGYLESMGQPVRQRPRPITSPTMEDVAATPIVVPVSFTTYDLPMLGGPVRQPRRVNQTPLEVEPLDRGTQTPPVPGSMDVPRPAAVRRPQASPNLPPITDPLSASPDFMAMNSRPRRAASPQIVVGGSPLPVPSVLQSTSEPVEPMFVQPRRIQPSQQQGAAAIIVDQQYFGGVVQPASYEGMAQQPRSVVSRRAIQAAIESSTTTSFYPTGNPPAFVGSGQIIVAAGGVWQAVGIVAGKVSRASKGI